MDVSHAQRAEEAVTRMLASIGDRSAAELCRDLERSKSIESKLAAYQARAAALLAALERHGDGGAGVLRHATGVSRRQAESQARTARILEDMPVVREALEDGRVSFANAARLAQAAEGTRSGDVEADADLIAKAESMTDDQFAREARRWTASHQPDDGEADYQRRRARRSLRLWDGDDGMTHMRGEFDPVTGERIRNRLEAEARRLRSTDASGAGVGAGGDGGGGKRGFRQAMADALDGLTATGSSLATSAGADRDIVSRASGSTNGAADSTRRPDHHNGSTNGAADSTNRSDHHNGSTNSAADSTNQSDHHNDGTNGAADSTNQSDHHNDGTNGAAGGSNRSDPPQRRHEWRGRRQQPVGPPQRRHEWRRRQQQQGGPSRWRWQTWARWEGWPQF